ncbi:MAG TPA: 8-amino-7-oxononanoate synthase [Planctomycetota bacterium]|nr:8-amino-7-oxononanoate synthase [Planctomycetota bacterium]
MTNWNEHLSSRLSAWKRQGLSRELKIAEGTGVRFKLRGKDVLSFASNDYLGLAAHPAVIAASKAALDNTGTGAGASPLIVGHKLIHAQLESALAAFKQSETALVFPSGFQAALAALGALAGENDSIILDRLSHASLIDGAKLSGARVRAFKHNDLDDLRKLLDSEHGRPCIVAVESLYSMDGDTAPLEELAAITRQAGALLLVDEAHATGVLGESGRGALEKLARDSGLPAHVIAMGTLSKALGSQGGYVCASKLVTDTIVHAGRAYLFSTALAPAAVAAASAALKLIDGEPERRIRLMQLSNSLRAALKRLEFPIVDSAGPIIPVLTGDEKRATACADALLARGIYVPAIRYPTVKKGEARLRISLSAGHTREDCQRLIDGLKSVFNN